MKHLKILVLFALTAHFVDAQSSVETQPVSFGLFQDWDWSQDKNAVVFADACNVRATPDQNGKLLGKLSIGTKLKLLEITNSKLTQNGIESPWIRISSGSLTGYIWGGTVTKGTVKLKDGKLVLWGLTEIRKSEDENQLDTVIASVRIFEKGVIILKHDFEVVYGDQPANGYLEIFPATELGDAKNVIVFKTLAEACGVYASMHYLVYSGSGLHFVGSGYSMGDSGILSTSLTYIFPSEATSEDYRFQPQPQHILLVEYNGMYEEDCSWTETSKVLDFTWEGNQLVKYCEQ